MPASEVSITKPLSGTECVEACIDALRKALAKDDRFSPIIAYPGFRAEVTFHFYPFQSYIPDVERTVALTEGEGAPTNEILQVKVELPVAPPNKVREDAGLPQPVLVTEPDGRAHEEWKKIAPVPKNQKPPKHNTVKGAA